MRRFTATIIMLLMMAPLVLASKKERKAQALREEWSAKIAAVATHEELESVRYQIQEVRDSALRGLLLGNAFLKEIQLDEIVYQEQRKRQLAVEAVEREWDAKVAAAEALEDIAALRKQAMTEENAGLRKYILQAISRREIRVEEIERKRKEIARKRREEIERKRLIVAEMRSRLDSRTNQIRKTIEDLKKTSDADLDVGLVSTIDKEILDLYSLGRSSNPSISWLEVSPELNVVVFQLQSELAAILERAREAESRRQQAAYQERQRKAREAEKRRRQALQEATERALAETEKELQALRALQDRLERIQSYCANGSLYFVETFFGGWVERDEATGEDSPVVSFDVNNEVLNRLLELQARGWKRKIPARTVACGEGDFRLWTVLR